jgi:hypothetical protein
MNLDTPSAYARHLATYIASPTKIEAYTRVEFGRAPPLHEIARMRLRVERAAKRECRPGWIKDGTERDGVDFAPASLLPRTLPPKPVKARIVRVPAEPKPPRCHLAPWRFEDMPDRVRTIFDQVILAFDITGEELTSKARSKRFVIARAVACRLVRSILNANGGHIYSLPRIGLYLGGRDHSTVCHAIAQFDTYRKQYPEVAEVYEKLRETVAA